MNDEGREPIVRRHLAFAWWTVLVYLTLGAGLEAAHALKLGLYVDVANQTRRLMWTLAHAHGTLLGLMSLGFAFTASRLGKWPERSQRIASRALMGATLLIPLGFFLGGLFIHAGDPGLGIVLVPAGALLLFVAVLVTARACRAGIGESQP